MTADYDPDVVHAGADPTATSPSDAAFANRIRAAAAQGGGRIWCPATGTGGYLLHEPLDLANLGDRPISIQGDGQVWENGSGTILIPDTGSRAAIDATGTSSLELSRFTIKSQARARGAQLLLLAGRTARWNFPQNHHYRDLILHAGSAPEANNRFGTVALANIACEHFFANGVRAKADVPFCLHGFNHLQLVPPHGAALTGPWSMTLATLQQCSGYAFHGPAYDLADCADVSLLNCHAQRDPANPFRYGIRLSGRVQALRIERGQIEQFASALEINGSTIGCEFAPMIGTPTAPCIGFGPNASVDGCIFRVSQINGNQPLFENAEATITGGAIYLESGQSLVRPEGIAKIRLRGVSIIGGDGEPIHVRADSNYTVNSPAGWYAVHP